MLALSIRADLRSLQRAFVDLRAKQAPFAMALALTRLAKGVQGAESEEVDRTFDHPTPFTENAFAIQPATKSAPIAIVFPKDIQERYLAPYVVGGDRFINGKKAMLAPKGAATNQYGNLTKGQLGRLLAKPGVFKGAIVTRSGRRIAGNWQRTPAAAVGKRRKGAAQPAGPLKLLIQFQDSTPAPKHLDFEGRARRYLRQNAAREFAAAMRQALATQRR